MWNARERAMVDRAANKLSNLYPVLIHFKDITNLQNGKFNSMKSEECVVWLKSLLKNPQAMERG